MKITKKSLLSVIAIVLVFALGGGVVAMAGTGLFTRSTETGYAHGTKVDKNGNFIFTYNGKTYDSEYDRLMAEDGYIYGIDDNWYGDYVQNQTVLGTNEILDASPAYLQGQVERRLYNMKALGYNTVNVWIHKDLGGFTFDDNGVVTGLNEIFTTNLRLLLDSCRKMNMNLAPSILNPGTASNYNQGTADLTPEEIWYKYFRFYYDETARSGYINALKQTFAILAEYQDVITLVNLAVENGTSVINDPSYDNQMNANRFGVTWEDYASLLNEMHDASKSVLPNVPTSVEDVAWTCNSSKYNDLKVDFIGYNFYGKKASSLLEIENRFQTRPAYIGEFNIDDNAATILKYDEGARGNYLTNLMDYYYHNGFMGSFYFFYYASGDTGYSFFRSSRSSDKYEDFCAFVPMLTYKIRDLKNEYHGTEGQLDQPALLYNHDSATNYWIVARNCPNYILERTEDGGRTWKVIADDIDTTTYQLDNGLMAYEDTTREAGKTYNYRVTGVTNDGRKTVSEVGNDTSVFVPVNVMVNANGEADGGFEQGTLLEGSWENMSEVGNSNGWYERLTNDKSVGQIVYDPENAHSGDHYFYVNLEEGVGDYGTWEQPETLSCWTYNLELQPNTSYTLTFWYKLIAYGGFSLTARNPETAIYNLVWTQPGYQLSDVERAAVLEAGKDGEWLQGSMTFTTPASGRVIICLQNNRAYDANNLQNTAFMLDDIEIYEQR